MLTAEPTATPTAMPSGPTVKPTVTPDPPNDECGNGAIDLTVNGPAVTGSNRAADLSSWCGEQDANWPAVWFTVKGNGRPLVISACEDFVDFDVDLSVQTSCGSSCTDVVEVDIVCDRIPSASLSTAPSAAPSLDPIESPGRSRSRASSETFNKRAVTFNSVINDVYFVMVTGSDLGTKATLASLSWTN
jgi:hypothetical protein